MTQLEKLQGLLDGLVAAGAPGAAAWVQDDHGNFQAASGLADLDSGRPMRPELHFRAGSLAKSFVAAVVLRLVAEGRLALSDTLERRLPGSLPYGDQVSIRQLLNHTSGVPQNTATVEQTLYASPQRRLHAWTPQELIALVADQPPDFPPGTAWSYSNTGYILLGLIVEAATGNPLERELDRWVFGPLGLRDTWLPTHARGIPARHRAATASPAAPAERCSTAPCWTSPSRTPRGPGRRAGWCPPWRTWPASSGVCWVAGCCRPSCWPRCGPPSRSRPVPSRSPSTTATVWGCWRSRPPPGAWPAKSAGSPAS